MKKILNLALVALLAVGAASCSKENALEGGDINPSGNTLTFTLSGAVVPGITYATVAPELGEYEIPGDKIDVLQFVWSTDGTGVFVKKYADVAITNVTNLTKKATISGVEKSGSITDYKYYVVANGSGVTSLAADLTGKTEAEVIELLTNASTAKIGTPLLMTGATTTAAGTTGNISVTVKRSVARFDIVKVKDANGDMLDITSVIINGAKQEAPVSYLAAGTTARTLTTNLTYDVSALTFATVDGTDRVIEKSVFYLNPTTVGTATGNTSIAIQASFKGGTPKLYHINGPVAINANYRYKLVANPENLTLNLIIAEWDDADDEYEFEANTSGTYSLSSPVGGTYDAINGLFTVETNTAASFTLEVPASSTEGFSASIATNHGTAPAIVATPQTITGGITYGAPHYKQTVDVTIPATTEVYSAILTLTDKAQSGTSFRINIRHTNGSDAVAEDGETPLYPTSTGELPAVKFGNLWWAPVNVGASTIDPSANIEARAGRLFQWGRSNVSWLSQPEGDFLATSQTASGPVSEIEGTTGLYKDLFITSTESPFDWVTPQNDNLWSASSNPCPNGWRLPIRNECVPLRDHLNNRENKGFDATNNRYVAISVDGKSELYFYLSGSIAESGRFWALDKAAAFWTESTSAEEIRKEGLRLSTEYGGATLMAFKRASAMSVRCVKDVQP